MATNNKTRIKQLERNAPKHAPKVEANPYMDMSKAEILEKVKATLENECLSNGEAIPEDAKKMLENALKNNGIAWSVKHDNE